MPITPNRRKARGKRRQNAVVALFVVFGLFVSIFAGVLWVAGGGPATASIGGPFVLIGGNGKSYSDRDFAGKYRLIYFGYTSCPDVCPTTLQQVANAMGRLGSKASEVQPIFITVDPARDTPEVVAQYAAAFSPDMIGLTGSPEQIAEVEKEYRIYAAIRRNPGGGYTVDHTSILYLMGPDGQFIQSIPADQTAPAIAATLAEALS